MTVHEFDVLDKEDRSDIIQSGFSWLAIIVAGVVGTLIGAVLAAVIISTVLPALA